MISKSAFRGLCTTGRAAVFANFARFSNLAPREEPGRAQASLAEKWGGARRCALRLAAPASAGHIPATEKPNPCSKVKVREGFEGGPAADPRNRVTVPRPGAK
jgi:hypothetical protein